MTSLPPDFAFSQGSLQDYADCPQRFSLRHVRRLAWPAPVAEPLADYEQAIVNGQMFHQLVHAHLAGLPVARLTDMARAAPAAVGGWWDNYLAQSPVRGSGQALYPEVGLAGRLGDYRLLARYDLLAVEPGRRLTIYDWKTGRLAPRGTLAARLQTRVYRHLAATTALRFNGGEPWHAEQISMVYWYAGEPERGERFDYDDEQAAADTLYLHALLERLLAELPALTGPDAAAPSADPHACAYCCYRSLCGVSGPAGSWSDELDDLRPAPDDFELDFEQVAESRF